MIIFGPYMRPLMATLVVALFSWVVIGPSVAAQDTAPVSSGLSDVQERGRYLTTAGDCIACHTKDGGQPFAGGRALETPFGTVVSANLTPDAATGIGSWTSDQFYRALHEGINATGQHLYPAFPYNYFTHITRADSDAIFAYLITLNPVANTPNRNQLSFPFSIRGLMIVWNGLFLKKTDFAVDPNQSHEWNRGAYLVEVLEHCGACHTPKNVLGAPQSRHALRGGRFAELTAPDLTGNSHTGLGSWSADEIVEFLRSGRNVHANASAEMGEVVADSTSHLSDDDLKAIAVYIKTQAASPDRQVSQPDPSAMKRGEAIFSDACSACHQPDAKGIPRLFPPLEHNANIQQVDPTTVIHFILTGARTASTVASPTAFTMPSFGWKLSDDEIAAVATFVRNSWGNAAPEVAPADVANLRQKLSENAELPIQ